MSFKKLTVQKFFVKFACAYFWEIKSTTMKDSTFVIYLLGW